MGSRDQNVIPLGAIILPSTAGTHQVLGETARPQVTPPIHVQSQAK